MRVWQGDQVVRLQYNTHMKNQLNISDTAPEAEAILLDLIRKQSPSERVQQAMSASRRVAEQCKRAIARSNPHFTEEDINLKFIEINYGKKLADEVREWLAAGRQR